MSDYGGPTSRAPTTMTGVCLEMKTIHRKTFSPCQIILCMVSVVKNSSIVGYICLYYHLQMTVDEAERSNDDYRL